MNGYKMLAEQYRMILDRPGVDQEAIQAQIESLETAAELSKSDKRYELFDTGLYNDLVKAFVEVACDDLEVDAKVKNSLLGHIETMFDMSQSIDIAKKAGRY